MPLWLFRPVQPKPLPVILFSPMSLHAITAKAEEEGFDVILQTSKSSEDDLLKCVSKIKQKMIKGIIMLSSPANESFHHAGCVWRTGSGYR